MPKRKWRKPTEADKQRKCYAHDTLSDEKYYVRWNEEWDCWGVDHAMHVLVRVDLILGLKGEDDE